jgi:DNA repair photolyase
MNGFASCNQTSACSHVASRVVVREIACKTILNQNSLSDYTLNCYTGCTHGCAYCYARFMQRFHPHKEPWGEFVDVKINAVEALKRQLRRLKPGEVFLSSACDGWQQIEAQYALTRRCCQLLLQYGFSVSVLTKSALLLRDMDVFSGNKAQIGVTVTTPDQSLSKLWEPQASSVEERFRVVQAARQAGLKTSIMFGPLLPLLSDGRETIRALFQRAADLQIGSIWVDALNPRPKVWPAVARLLRDHFPELRQRYYRILFDQNTRAEYLERLRKEVTLAAENSALNDRVAVCF